MILLIPIVILGCLILLIRRKLKLIEYTEPVKTIDNRYVITEKQLESMRKRLQRKRSKF